VPQQLELGKLRTQGVKESLISGDQITVPLLSQGQVQGMRGGGMSLGHEEVQQVL
jgi:hypothetical protein